MQIVNSAPALEVVEGFSAINKKFRDYLQDYDVLNKLARNFDILVPVINLKNLSFEYAKIHATERCIIPETCLINAIKENNFELVEKHFKYFKPEYITYAETIEMFDILFNEITEMLVETTANGIIMTDIVEIPCITKGMFNKNLYEYAYQKLVSTFGKWFYVYIHESISVFFVRNEKAIEKSFLHDVVIDLGRRIYAKPEIIGPNVYNSLSSTRMNGEYISVSCRNFRAKFVIELLKSGEISEVNLIDAVTQEHVEIQPEDDPSLVEYLIEQGYEVTNELIMFALENHNFNIAKVLLQNYKGDLKFPIIRGIHEKNRNIFKDLDSDYNISMFKIIKDLSPRSGIFDEFCEMTIYRIGCNVNDDTRLLEYIRENANVIIPKSNVTLTSYGAVKCVAYIDKFFSTEDRKQELYPLQFSFSTEYRKKYSYFFKNL